MRAKGTGRNQGGFTLIELMIVIAIIGILAAIAVPQFSRYRQNAFHSMVKADLRNAATSQEAYFVDKKRYCSTLPPLQANYKFILSEGMRMSVTSTASSYTFVAYHTSGSLTYTLTGPGGVMTSN